MNLDRLQDDLGHHFNDQGLLQQALCHRSAAEEGLVESYNERLEFLGDSVLQVCITHILYQRFPTASEGDLSRIRARLVNKEFLASIARGLSLGPLLVLGKGEQQDGPDKSSLLADAFEAVLGALFLDAELKACQSVVLARFAPTLGRILDPSAYGKHPKSALQELTMGQWRHIPDYSLVEATGPAHQRRFVYSVAVGGIELAQGAGASKQLAQAEAARAALLVLEKERE